MVAGDLIADHVLPYTNVSRPVTIRESSDMVHAISAEKTPAPEVAVWPSPGGSLPQPGQVLSRSGSGPLSEAEAARQQPEADERTLLAAVAKANNKTGYFGVYHSNPGEFKPYQARVKRGGKIVSLGSFVTAEAAALCVARSPEGQQAAAKEPLTSEEARQQARAEGLTLLVADSKTNYFGVCNKQPGRSKPFHAQVKRGGKQVYLGSFATAEEAALRVARSPEGQEAAKNSESRTAKKRPVAAAELASEEEAQRVAANVQSCRAAEDDVLAMLSMAMEATVSEEVLQQAETRYDTEGNEAEEQLAVLLEAYYERL